MTLTTLLFIMCQPTECLIFPDADGLNVFTHRSVEERSYVIDGTEVFIWRHEVDNYRRPAQVGV